jgi:hypothetical protein
LDRFKGKYIVENAGHWVQAMQEKNANVAEW